MHMLDSISKSKDTQAIKFSQLIESTMRNHAENEALRLVLDLFCTFEKYLKYNK